MNLQQNKKLFTLSQPLFETVSDDVFFSIVQKKNNEKDLQNVGATKNYSNLHNHHSAY